MRIDYGNLSVITNPAKLQMIVLDHVKQEFKVIPTAPAVPQMKAPSVPGMPGAPAIPTTPAMVVKDLGIKMVQGIEVMGRQITLPPIPGAPSVPGMPAKPGLPAAPAAALPMIAETWISTKLKMPVLSRITGSFGQQMCFCKNTVAGEPPPSSFQIPPNYKQAGLPQAPAPPSLPGAPMPQMSTPKAPSMQMPSAPPAPQMPSAPQIPKPKSPFGF
jgi:hypothetical protein